MSAPLGHPFLLGLTLAAWLAGGTLTTAAADPSPPREPHVLTSFLPLHSLALVLAGSRARVENWLPPGVDPHDFQFSPRDLRRLRDADLLIVGGLGLERWNEARLRTLSGNPALRLVEAAAGLSADALIEDLAPHERHAHESSHGDEDHPPNPHFWLDPLLVAHAATNILRALQTLDPAGAAVYEANAREGIARLHALHREFERGLAPCTHTAFLTLHSAYPYLARRYRLRLVGVVEALPGQEPSARELSGLAEVARRENAQVLFVDARPPRLARQFAADLKLKLATLDRLETGEFGLRAYEDGMRRNLAALQKALQPVTAR